MYGAVQQATFQVLEQPFKESEILHVITDWTNNSAFAYSGSAVTALHEGSL